MPRGFPSRRLSRTFAKRFCETLASSDQAIFQILAAHPEFPSWAKLRKWRDQTPWFSEMWRKAREDQAEHLAQKCLDLAAQADSKNAHACRVKFDVYKWVASRFSPAIYGDRPTAPTTNIAIGVSVSAERLNEIRSKLDITRSLLSERTVTVPSKNGHTVPRESVNKPPLSVSESSPSKSNSHA